MIEEVWDHLGHHVSFTRQLLLPPEAAQAHYCLLQLCRTICHLHACTALCFHCTAFHCTAFCFHCTALNCTAPSLDCFALHCTTCLSLLCVPLTALKALHCPPLRCLALLFMLFAAVPFIAFPCTAFHCLCSTALLVSMLQGTVLLCTILHYAVLLSTVPYFLARDIRWAVNHTVMLQGGCLQAHQDCLIMQVPCCLLHRAQGIATGLFNHKFHQPYQADQYLRHLQKHASLQWMGIWLVGGPRLRQGDRPVDFMAAAMHILKQHFACTQICLRCNEWCLTCSLFSSANEVCSSAES